MQVNMQTPAADKYVKRSTGGIAIGSDYETERTRKMKADADIAEIQLAKLQGTLCVAEDVIKAWETVLQACKAKFLAMPTKTAPLLANEIDVAAIQIILEEQVKEALSELSNYQPSIDPVNTGASSGEPVDSDEAVDPAPAPKRSRMGRPKKTARLAK
jgi:hypothetical protein